jgi:hypothetical protein
MSPRNRPRQRARIRRRVVTMRIIAPGIEPPPRRTNRYGYQFANAARFDHGRQEAEAMASQWTLAGFVCRGHRGAFVAWMYGTSRAAVYQRMYRYRRGLYSAEHLQRRCLSPSGTRGAAEDRVRVTCNGAAKPSR